jgi:hypothetical protein
VLSRANSLAGGRVIGRSARSTCRQCRTSPWVEPANWAAWPKRPTEPADNIAEPIRPTKPADNIAEPIRPTKPADQLGGPTGPTEPAH